MQPQDQEPLAQVHHQIHQSLYKKLFEDRSYRYSSKKNITRDYSHYENSSTYTIMPPVDPDRADGRLSTGFALGVFFTLGVLFTFSFEPLLLALAFALAFPFALAFALALGTWVGGGSSIESSSIGSSSSAHSLDHPLEHWAIRQP